MIFAYCSRLLSPFALQALVEGYGAHEMFDERFQLRLLLHRLGLQMGYVASAPRHEIQPEARFLTVALAETLSQLRAFRR